MNNHDTVTLYEFGNSVCCQKVRITLVEKGLSWDEKEVNLFKNEQYSPEYLALNPSGVVPTLVLGQHVVTESTLICEYLDEMFPMPPLVPRDPLARTRMRCWSKIVDEGLHEGISEISFSAMFRERMKNMSETQRMLRFRNVGDPRRRDRFMSTFELGTRSPFVAHGVAAYERAFKRLETTLAQGGPWILGDQLTLADINVIPYVARLAYLGLLDLWTADRPHVQAWWNRVQIWPSYKVGLVDRILPREIDEMAQHGPAIANDLGEILHELRSAPLFVAGATAACAVASQA